MANTKIKNTVLDSSVISGQSTVTAASNDLVLIQDVSDSDNLKKALVSDFGTSFAGIDDQSSSNDDQLTITDSAVIINEDSDDVDFRIEGNGDANLFFTDAGNDRIGIKTNSPSTELHVVGGIKATGAIDFDGGGFTFNESGAAVDFRAETDTLTNAFFIDGSADKIGFGTNSPANALVEINQASSTGAIACISLDQDDQDQAFIHFDGTEGSGSTASISTSTDEGGSKVGAIKIKVGSTERYIRIYDSAV